VFGKTGTECDMPVIITFFKEVFMNITTIIKVVKIGILVVSIAMGMKDISNIIKKS